MVFWEKQVDGLNGFRVFGFGGEMMFSCKFGSDGSNYVLNIDLIL